MLRASDVRTRPTSEMRTRPTSDMRTLDVPYLGHADTPYLGHADVEMNLSIASGGRETGRTPQSAGLVALYSYSC